LDGDVLQQVKNDTIDVNVVAGANVQEEVGLRGAKVAANKIKPDLAIAVDVAIAYDTPGMSGQVSDTAIGNGPVVIIRDASNIGHVGFTKHIKEVAKTHNISFQLATTAGGGTDAGSIHVANEGIPTVSIGVALRYMHSNVSVLHTDDYKNSVALVAEIVKSLNDDVVEEIIW
ncbi:peptidase M28, partial [Mammaliicoccus sciuri]